MKNLHFFPQILAITFSLFLFLSCSDTKNIDPASERINILEILNLEREYHFKKMAKEFVGLQSEDFISINKGVITQPAKEERIDRFSKYFSSVDFESWDDITPPVIKFSDDYSVAYVAVHKEVIFNYLNESDEKVKDSTEFAWLAVYKKYRDTWKLDAIASTNRPDSKN